MKALASAGAFAFLGHSVLCAAGRACYLMPAMPKPADARSRALPETVDIAPLLPGIQKAARYIGGEVGSVRKHPASVALRVALCFPDIYEVAESYLGLKILYDLLNRDPQVFAERVYAPWDDMVAALERNSQPLFSLETRTPLDAFDLVGFSVNHEFSYTTLLHMLELGRLPLRAARRGPDHPIVLIGGPATVNPEPLAPFADAFFVGDGEDGVLEIAASLMASQGQPRADRLAALEQIEGVLLPHRHRPILGAEGRLQGYQHDPGAPTQVRARKVADLDATPGPVRWIAPHLRAVHDRAVAEIQRGCSKGCRFCQAGMIYRPTRQRSPRRVRQLLEAAVHGSGHEQAGLLSLSAGDYPLIEPLLAELDQGLARHRVRLSVPSLRTETLSDGLAQRLMRSGSGGFTLAPEAATERLRQVIAKGNDETDLLRSVRAAVAAGASKLKLYFMIGLPTETDADELAIATLSQRRHDEARRVNRRTRISVSVSTFVPKAHTPFQWEAQLGRDEVRRRQAMLREALAGSKVVLRYHDADMSLVEGLYARGDRRLADVLEGAYRRGARLDAWGEHFDARHHLEALAEQGLEPAELLRARELDEALPWDLVDLGLLRKFLLRERRDAHAEQSRQDCVGDRCLACGVCDFDQHRVIRYLATAADSETRVEHPLRHRSNKGLQPVPAADSAPAPEPLPAEGDLRPGQRVADVRVARLRLRLSKRPPAVHLSHLETMAALQRALARAGIPVASSGGFSPRPRLAVPFALPVGVESEDELVDVDLRQHLDAVTAMALLQPQLPHGMRVLDAICLDVTGPGLGVLLAGSRYRVRLDADPAELCAAIARYHAAPSWPVVRERKGKRRELDLKELLSELVWQDDAVQFVLRTPAEGSLKPVQVLDTLFGELAQGARFHKLASLFVHDFPASDDADDTAEDTAKVTAKDAAGGDRASAGAGDSPVKSG